MARTTSKTTASTDDLSQQLDALKADVQALTETLGHLSKAQGIEVKSSAMDKAAALHNASSEQLSRAKGAASDVNDQASEFVRSQPATALGIAAGFGFLVGMVSSRA